MEPKQFHRRVWAMVVLLAMILTGMGATLYDLQINNGEENYKQSQSKIAETEVVEAGRGQILDRSGRPLVSDRAVYQVRLDTKLMGKDLKDPKRKVQARNDTLLSLIGAAREHQVEWVDTLPITKTEPFVFTTEDPYFTVGRDEAGNEVKSLTLLGKLAVNMKWIKDPTAAPEEEADEPAPKEPGFFEKVKNFFTGGPKEEAPVEEEPYVLPDARQLLGLMCRSFEVKGQGAVDEDAAQEAGQPVPELNIGDMDPADARAVAGVLYELYLRSRDVYRAASYCFAQEVDIDFISRVKELGLPGVVFEARTVRQYHTKYAAHLLGQVGVIYQDEWEYYKNLDTDGDGVPDYQMDDTVGKSGVEYAFESYLRGTPGKRTVERNTSGKVVSQEWVTAPKPGDNVVLTLDLDLQTAVENILASALPQLPSKEVEGAACVVLDVNTADVLAMASYPTFDLSTYNADWTELAKDPLSPALNRATQGLYAPGSTFKMVTGIAGLEEGIITPSTQIRDLGAYTYYPGSPPRCWIYRQKGTTHGLQNVSEAIENSCNYFFFDVGRRLGIEKLDDYASRFGLGQKTGLELGEQAGALAGPAFTESLGGTWYEGSTLSVAIGQESTQVTPLQLANYIATLVNGGTRNATHLLKEVKSSDFSQVRYTYEPRVLSTIDIQDKNLDAVKKGMLDLTTRGSVSRYFKDLGVQVGAKTGSAQVSLNTESNAVFVCFAPYDDPEVAIAIAVEHGGGGSELGAIAAPILEHYFSAQEGRDEPLTENTLVR